LSIEVQGDIIPSAQGTAQEGGPRRRLSGGVIFGMKDTDVGPAFPPAHNEGAPRDTERLGLLTRSHGDPTQYQIGGFIPSLRERIRPPAIIGGVIPINVDTIN